MRLLSGCMCKCLHFLAERLLLFCHGVCMCVHEDGKIHTKLAWMLTMNISICFDVIAKWLYILISTFACRKTVTLLLWCVCVCFVCLHKDGIFNSQLILVDNHECFY